MKELKSSKHFFIYPININHKRNYKIRCLENSETSCRVAAVPLELRWKYMSHFLGKRSWIWRKRHGRNRVELSWNSLRSNSNKVKQKKNSLKSMFRNVFQPLNNSRHSMEHFNKRSNFSYKHNRVISKYRTQNITDHTVWLPDIRQIMLPVYFLHNAYHSLMNKNTASLRVSGLAFRANSWTVE